MLGTGSILLTTHAGRNFLNLATIRKKRGGLFSNRLRCFSRSSLFFLGSGAFLGHVGPYRVVISSPLV